MEDVERIVEERLRRARDEGLRPDGLLFHGTCEDVEGPLTGGGYDGVLWTASTPIVAQQYIPASGSTVIVPAPMDWELSDSVRPDRDSWWHGVARKVSGLQCTDVETDLSGRATAWCAPEGWPSYRECVRHVENVLGYSRAGSGSGYFEVKQSLTGGIFTDMPSDWQMQGTLFVTLADGLRFKDLRRSEDGDLTDLEYHDVEAFRQAASEGFDGVTINDFAQVDGHGNVGHVSYGLLPSGIAKTQWVRMDAVRRPLRNSWSTPDTDAWLQSRDREDILCSTRL